MKHKKVRNARVSRELRQSETQNARVSQKVPQNQQVFSYLDIDENAPRASFLTYKYIAKNMALSLISQALERTLSHTIFSMRFCS